MDRDIDPLFTTIQNAAKRTGKSERSIWRYIKDNNLDTAIERGRTLVHMPGLRSAIAKITHGRPQRDAS